MSLRILSGGTLVEEPWPWQGDWHVFGGNVHDYRGPTGQFDPITIWRTQRNVRTVVGFLARNFAQVPLHAFERIDDDERRRLGMASKLGRLVKQPDPALTGYEFAYNSMVDLCLFERWAAVKLRSEIDGRPAELLRIPPEKFRFKRDQWHRPIGVRMFDENAPDPQSKWLDIGLDRFVWLDGYPTRDEERWSPMEYLVSLLIEEVESAKYRQNMWKNGARFSGWIERPKDAPPWKSPAHRQRFGERMREAYRGGGTHEGGIPLLEDDMKFHTVEGVTPEQAQQIEARKLTMSEVASAFHVSPELVGARPGTYSNIQAYREGLYTETLGPAFQQSGQAWNARLVPDIAEDPDSEYVEHNVAEKLKLSFEEQAKVLQSAVGAPYLLRNEARRRMNLSDVPGGDELVVPLNVVIGGQASPQDSRPDLVTGGES